MSKRARHIAEIAIVAVVYFATAGLSFAIHLVNGFESLIWVPTSIGLAAVLLLGDRVALGILLGVFVSMEASNHSALAGIGIGTIEALEAVGAAWVLRRAFAFRTPLDRVRDVLALVGLSVVLALVTATLDSCVLAATGLIPSNRLTSVLSTWWWGYLAGSLVVTPLVLAWGTRTPDGGIARRASALEVVAFGVATLVLCSCVFAPSLPERLTGAPMPYVLVVLLLWAGLRFGPRGASATTFTVSALAIFATTFGYGPFVHLPHFLQIFVSISSVMTLALSALQVERLTALQRKSAILTGALDAIVTIDGDGRIVEFNPAAEGLFDVSGREAVGKDVAMLLIPRSLRDPFRAALTEAVCAGTSDLIGRRRLSLQRANGSEFPAEVTAMVVPIKGQRLFTGFVRDITAELTAERALQESHALLEQKVRERTIALVAANQELEHKGELLRDSQALANLGSFERDLGRDRLEWSEEMYRIYGQDPATFVPHDGFVTCIHPDDRARVALIIQRSRVDRLPFAFEMRIVRPNLTIRTLYSQGRVCADETGRVLRVTGYSQDVTERKRAEEASHRLGELVKSSEDAIIGLSIDGTIESWNRAAEKIFGYAAAEVIGKPARLLVSEDRTGELEQVLASVRAGQHLDHYEFVYVRRDNTGFDASVTTSAIVDHEGHVIGMSKVVRDISDQKLGEAKLRSALREKDVLLREIHHRVKNNLQVISSLLNLQALTVASVEARNRLEESQGRIQSMALVHQLLYRSKDLSHIDLLEYVQDLVQRLSQAYGGEPDRPIEISVDVPNIRLDIDRAIPCGLIVNELVTNSFKHAFPGQRRGRIWVRLAQEGGELALDVRDDGVGMPPDFDLEAAQTLGLQIVRTLAHQLNGRVELADRDGTIVRVVFPFAEAVAKSSVPHGRGDGSRPIAVA